MASVAARREWDLKPVEDRAQILFKAADVIGGPKRAEILAKTMIGQVAKLELSPFHIAIHQKRKCIGVQDKIPDYHQAKDN